MFNVDNDLQTSMTVNTAACSDASAFIISVWSSLRKSVISCTDVGMSMTMSMSCNIHFDFEQGGRPITPTPPPLPLVDTPLNHRN